MGGSYLQYATNLVIIDCFRIINSAFMTYGDVMTSESLNISAESVLTPLEMITQTDRSTLKKCLDSVCRMRQKAKYVYVPVHNMQNGICQMSRMFEYSLFVIGQANKI